MVHKVTMDTVRIITSSVSGMTNVSVSPTPWARALQVTASPVCVLHQLGANGTCPESCPVAIWDAGKALILPLPELLPLKMQFQRLYPRWEPGPPEPQAVAGTQRASIHTH